MLVKEKAVTGGVLSKKMFLNIWQNSRENICVVVSFLNKVGGLRPATILKKRLQNRCFPMNSNKIFINTFLYITTPMNASERNLLLENVM